MSQKNYFFTLLLLTLGMGALTDCSRAPARNRQNEEGRTKKKDNYLFSQAKKMIHYNKKNESSREKEADKKEKRHLSFLKRLNKKDDNAQAKALVPPFKP